MPAYVIDTNVGVVANGRSPQADVACQSACVEKLKECVDILNNKKPGYVVIDSGGEILREYGRHFLHKGQPGVGDMFFKVLNERRFSENCEQVKINKDVNWEYEEFPHDEDLRNFDLSDRKFVAVAKNSLNSPVILNATDSDWRTHRRSLEKYVRIEELCPNCLRQ